jgi:hypothetical protein
MPVVMDFKGQFPQELFRPYVVLSGASTVQTKAAVIVLDTGYSGGLAMAPGLRAKTAIPEKGVALKIMPLSAIDRPSNPIVESSIVDTNAAPAVTLRVDVAVRNEGRNYNVLSIGFLKANNWVGVLLPGAQPRYPIHIEKSGLEEMKIGLYSTDVQFFPRQQMEEQAGGFFHVPITWGGESGDAQPFLRTAILGPKGGPEMPFLWDTGCNLNQIDPDLARELGLESEERCGEDVVVLPEVSLLALGKQKLKFKNVPCIVGTGSPDGITIGSALLGQFAEIVLCTKVGARDGLHFSFRLKPEPQ